MTTDTIDHTLDRQIRDLLHEQRRLRARPASLHAAQREQLGEIDAELDRLLAHLRETARREQIRA